jgi:hypothetical protein
MIAAFSHRPTDVTRLRLELKFKTNCEKMILLSPSFVDFPVIDYVFAIKFSQQPFPGDKSATGVRLSFPQADGVEIKEKYDTAPAI